jgi:acetyl/propionyl-CoA carboxylase alpha subunit
MARKLRSILIPNRGEIALRIVRSARALGIRSVVAYSEADAASAAVEIADDAVPLGPAPAAESYLSIERILAAARRAGVDAIHPGYGFLSEREAFARAVEESGCIFIGPTPENIRAMGDKVAAREALAALGIPIVPGERGPVRDPSRLRELASRVGLPLLLKAAAGGGGKGIRLVRDADAIDAAFRLASSEARHAFGDDTLFAERYLERARHVEVQIVGDGRGGARIYPERDCSIQRRHQKLVEESPCGLLDARRREELLRMALKAVEHSRYRGAGTLEFLFDGERFYFLEMNTRLQVEHPVTEMVTGADLVAAQIAVASGESLPGKRLDLCSVPGRGAAIEARVNAEDPLRDFRPSIGRLASAVFPGGPGVRVDTAARPGMEMTPHYDSLLAKLIAWGEDRGQAMARLRVACEETVIAGVSTTLAVALALLDDAAFRGDRHHCQHLEERLADAGFICPAPDEDLAVALALAAGRLRVGAAPAAAAAGRAKAPRGADELSPWARLGRTYGLRGQGAGGA